MAVAALWIWQQPDWLLFRWKSDVLEPLLEQARAARQELQARLETREPPFDRAVIPALLGRKSLGTAAIGCRPESAACRRFLLTRRCGRHASSHLH